MNRKNFWNKVIVVLAMLYIPLVFINGMWLHLLPNWAVIVSVCLCPVAMLCLLPEHEAGDPNNPNYE